MATMGTTTEAQMTAQATAGRGVKLARFTAAAVIALAWASSTQATILLEARAVVEPDFACSMAACAPDDDIVKGMTGPVQASAFAEGGFEGVGSATAAVNWGDMHLVSQFTNAGNALAIGQIVDQLVFTAPGVAPGTPMQVNFSIRVEGAIEGSNNNGAAGEWLLQSNLGGGAYQINASAQDYGGKGYVGDPFGIFTGTATVFAGDVEGLDIELTASALSSTGDVAVADLSHTLLWDGISDVTVGGVAVNDFTVTSASGTNWANSFIPTGVPEPAAWAMMLVGFGGLGATMRRRQRLAAGPA
jgi:hypothetical protein